MPQGLNVKLRPSFQKSFIMPLPGGLLLDVADVHEACVAVHVRLVVADAGSHVHSHVMEMVKPQVQQVLLKR